jgi:hypothetical protein
MVLGRIGLLMAFLLGVLAFLLPETALAQTGVLYGPNGVSPMAVKQGTLGSCYFHASIAAVAKVSPAAIKSAISGDAQRGYKVHFLSGPEEVVYPQDIAYAHEHAYDRSEGEWVTVLMRGYAQRALRHSMVEAVNRSTTIPIFAKPIALNALDQTGPLLLAYDRAVRSVVSQDGQMDKASFEAQLNRQIVALGVPAAQAQVIGGLLEQGGFYEAIAKSVRDNGEVFGAYRSLGQGGIPFSVLEALLGPAHSSPVTDASLAGELRRLHGGGEAVVAGTKPSAGSSSGADWFVPTHAYTVLDYDEGSRMVLLRNPWGAKPGPDGVFKLPLSVFQQVYENFSYAAPGGRN